jgi:hypothetical protein
MRSKESVTFVVPTNNRTVLERNFLASPFLSAIDNLQLLVQEDYDSAAKAYNDAIDRSTNNLIIFVHQDVFLPGPWLSQLERALVYLEETDPQWGVLGCFGATRTGQYIGHVFTTGQGVVGKPFEVPTPVQTLDEIVLVLRKSSGLRFDERLRGFHFYGTDICMTAAKQGRKCYAIPAFCIHNTQQPLILPEQFYACYKQVKRIWKDYLPIETSCIRISRFDVPIRICRLKEFCLRFRHGRAKAACRVEDPNRILTELNAHGEGLIQV